MVIFFAAMQNWQKRQIFSELLRGVAEGRVWCDYPRREMSETAGNSSKTVCVYCASSRVCDPEYHSQAHRLGQVLAENGFTIIYGGGGAGSMGALADGAISRNGKIIGVLPRFMQELEWGHSGLSELRLVEDMRTRKHMMLAESAAVVALPGGCGTLEELLEAITLKRLGLYVNPIVLVNTRQFFNPLMQLLNDAVSEGFMHDRHRLMWQVVDTPEEVPAAFKSAPGWSHDARNFAAL
jgi:uncharacterized protein (TIGR00730 family)